MMTGLRAETYEKLGRRHRLDMQQTYPEVRSLKKSGHDDDRVESRDLGGAGANNTGGEKAQARHAADIS
jgi:hypothetical protein